MNRWPLPEFASPHHLHLQASSSSQQQAERNFVYNFDPEDVDHDPDVRRIDFSHEDHRISDRMIRPVFRNGDLDHPSNKQQQIADLAKSYSFHGEGAALVPSYVVTELQNEVSSLLDFKNALLETFPHLQNRFATTGSSVQPGRGSQTYVGRRDQRPGYLLGHPQPYVPTRHVDVVSSDETQPSWSGLETGQLTTGYQTGQNSTGSTSTVPGSTNVGTSMSTSRGFRKSSNGSKKNFPDSSSGHGGGHLAADSGFSTETSKETASGGSAILSPTSATVRSSAQQQGSDVRWDWPPITDQGGRGGGGGGGDDELMFLLDLIHRKSVKLRNEVEDTSKVETGQQDGGNLQRSAPRLAHASPLRVIDENDPPESAQSSAIHNQASKKLELEVDTLRREREVLISRIGELESENASTHGRVSQLEGEIFRLTSTSGGTSATSSSGGSESKKAVIEKKEDAAGIIHSVHIRTGGGEEGIRRTTRSVSQGDLTVPLQSVMRSVATGGSSVNIEIKNGELIKSRSQDHLAQGGPPQAPSRNLPHHYQQQHRYSQPSNVLAPAISVVNLRHPPGVLENLLPHQHNKSHSFNELTGGQSRFHSRAGANSFGVPQLVRTQYNARGVLLPGRMAVPSAEGVSTNGDAASKSKSVENLNNDPYGLPVLGLKPANSEMNMHRHPSVAHLMPNKPNRLKGTTSELNVSKLGQSEKVRFDIIDGITSLPAEMTKGLRPNHIKPNREKIRAILSMSNVIELQRQLLTTVMENEVYRSQLERVSESWREKIGSFEKINAGLQSSCNELRQENDDLKYQVKQKTSELESAKSRLRALGQDLATPAGGSGDQTSHPHHDEASQAGRQTPTSKTTENRVHFDLRNSRPTPTPTRLKTTLTTTPGVVSTGLTMGTRRLLPGPHTTQLPSDARQRLEEMANSGIRRQPFLGNQLKPVTTSSTTLNNTTTTTATASTLTTSAQPTNSVATSTPPTRTPRRTSSTSSTSGSRSNSPVKTVHLDPIQELLSQHQHIVGNKSASVAIGNPMNAANPNTAALSSNQHRQVTGGQNGSTNYNISGQQQQQQQHRMRRESTGTLTSSIQGRTIPQTPLSREKSLNLKNTTTGSSSSNNNSSELVYSGNNVQRQTVEHHSGDLDSSDMIENNNSKKDKIVGSTVGADSDRDTIAGFIAGILQKYSNNKGEEEEKEDCENYESLKAKPGTRRQAFAEVSMNEEDFSEISLDDRNPPEPSDLRQPSPLFQKSGMNAAYLSLPHSIGGGKRSASYCGSSWEANNHLEEQTHGSHVLRRDLNLPSHPSRHDRIMLEELEERCFSSATVSQDSLRSSKKFTDSLSHFDDNDKTAAFEMDSITYDFRQASPDDSLNNQQLLQHQQQNGAKYFRQDTYYDSLGEFAPTPKIERLRKEKPITTTTPQKTKKLIIPYNNDSFSSNTSICTGSRESLAGSDYDVSISSKTAEPDSLTPCMSAVDRENDHLTLEISALQQGRNNSVSEDESPQFPPPTQMRRASSHTLVLSSSPKAHLMPEVWRPEGFHQPYNVRHHPEVGSSPGSRTASPTVRSVMSQQNNPLVNQSLMRMATERMKRKFLGWN